MSDFNDFLNDHAGYYAALGGIAGVAQRGQSLANQQTLIQKQIEQEQRRAQESKKAAANAAKLAELEAQRLEIEKQRLRWEIERDHAQGERRQRIVELRKVLSAMLDELATLKRQNVHNNEPSSDID